MKTTGDPNMIGSQTLPFHIVLQQMMKLMHLLTPDLQVSRRLGDTGRELRQAGCCRL